MLCKVCEGSENFFVRQNNEYQWWNCPCCDGDGTALKHNTKPIKMHRTGKKIEKINKELHRQGLFQ